MGYSINGYTPQQGDIVWINFNPSTGREIQKKRPALVISSDDYNATTGFIIVCPITSTKKQSDHLIPLSVEHSIQGKINPLQVKGFDYMSKEREVTFVEKAKIDELGMVAQIVDHIFSFNKLIGS